MGEVGLQACVCPSEVSGHFPLSPTTACFLMAPLEHPQGFSEMSCRKAALCPIPALPFFLSCKFSEPQFPPL